MKNYICVVLLCVVSFVAGNYTITKVTNPVVLGEGPHWDEDEKVLYFVDIPSMTVNKFNPRNGEVTSVLLEGEGKVTLVIPVKNSPGDFIVSKGRDILLLHWDGENKTASNDDVHKIASIASNKPDDRFNDGKADTSGRFWAGSMGPETEFDVVTPFLGGLYSIDSNTTKLVTQESNISISNGLDWNEDNSIMYYIDTATRRVDKFDFNIEAGKLLYRRPAFEFDKYNVAGNPDGMAIDTDGNLWVACFNGFQVIKVNPRTNELLQRIVLPAQKVTSVSFGGKNKDEMYVTTAKWGLSEEQLAEQPDAGSVFKVEGLGVRGTKNNKVVRQTEHCDDH